jgi:N-acylneuraminate cytidylyltransferase
MIIAIIPAKGESSRLPNKNMAQLAGRPLLYYTIKTAKDCRAIDKIYVSTDSTEIAQYAKNEGVSVIMRPVELGGETPIVKVYFHALNNIKERDVSYIVGLQPDHPDRRVNLDEVIEYVIEKKLDDLISIDSSGKKNGSIRIMKVEAMRERRISISIDSLMDDATNIHTLQDLKLAEKRIKKKEDLGKNCSI